MPVGKGDVKVRIKTSQILEVSQGEKRLGWQAYQEEQWLTVYTNRSSPRLQGHWNKDSCPNAVDSRTGSLEIEGSKRNLNKLTRGHPFKKPAFPVGLQPSPPPPSPELTRKLLPLLSALLWDRSSEKHHCNRKNTDQSKQQNWVHEIRQCKASPLI